MHQKFNRSSEKLGGEPRGSHKKERGRKRDNPQASEGSREVANSTERKNPHTPVYGVKECVCLSVINFDPNYLRTGRTEWPEIALRTSKAKRRLKKKFVRKVVGRAGAEDQKSNILTQYKKIGN